MVTLEIPHINVMGKLDLLDKKAKKDIERQETCRMEIIIIIAYENSFNCFFFRYLDPDTSMLLSELKSMTDKKFHKLNKAICSLVSWK